MEPSTSYVGTRPRLLASMRGLRTRRGIRLTAEGWGWLVIALVLWTIAFSKGINLLLLLSYLMLLTLALHAFFAGRQLRGVTVCRRPVEPLFVNQPADIELAVACSRAGAHGLRIEDRGESHVRQWYFDRLESRATCRGAGAVVVAHRGWYAWGPVRLVSGYPLGLVERVEEGEPGRPVLVFPARGELHRGRFRRFLYRSLPGAGEVRRQARRHPSAQGEFHGLREFRQGDSPRWVHWRTSARRGNLMVREFEEPPPDDLILVVEAWLPTAGRFEESERARDRLEEAIAFAATVCSEWCRHGGDRILLAVAGPGEPVIVEGTAGKTLEPLLLEALAVVPGGPIAEERLIGALGSRTLPAAPVLFLSTRVPKLGDALGQRLGRPVVGLAVEEILAHDFYQPPENNAKSEER